MAAPQHNGRTLTGHREKYRNRANHPKALKKTLFSEGWQKKTETERYSA